MVTVELLERVRAATGPDRELDVLLECMAGDTHSHGHRPSTVHGKVVHYYNSSGRSGTYKASRYTLCVDAAIELAERVLPFKPWIEIKGVNERPDLQPIWGVLLDGAHEGRAPTLPLAILAALLTALIAKETP